MTHLTEQQLATTLKEAVPEPAANIHRANKVRKLATRVRKRRRLVTSSLAVGAALAVTVPVVTMSNWFGSGSDALRPAGPSNGRTVGPAVTPCGADCDPATVRAELKRPLQLPTVLATGACPVSPTRTFPGGAGFTGAFSAIGDGPLYAVPIGRAPGPWAFTPADGSPWRGLKVIWVIDRDYFGPLLLRGSRIDASGKLGFAHYLGAVGYPGYGAGDGKPHSTLLYIRGGLNAPERGSLDSNPSGVYAKSPGCYAVQVDGQGFTETLVFQATWHR